MHYVRWIRLTYIRFVLKYKRKRYPFSVSDIELLLLYMHSLIIISYLSWKLLSHRNLKQCVKDSLLLHKYFHHLSMEGLSCTKKLDYTNIFHRRFCGGAEDLPESHLDGADGIQFVSLDCSPSIISSRRLDQGMPMTWCWCAGSWRPVVSTERAVVDEGGWWSISPLDYLLAS